MSVASGRLFIAEKPSLAEKIAEALAQTGVGKRSRGEGCHVVGPDVVTWLFGHMYEQAQPGDYEERWKKWALDDLPLEPGRWKLSVHPDKRKQVKVVADLLKKAGAVVHAGDAGREGQLLVDELLVELGWKGPTERLWVKSYAMADMTAALASMRPNAEYRPLFEAAQCRQRADWLHGINLTRLYTLLARRAGADLLVSVGRVQSPTLKIVVDRDREIDRFRPTDHFQPTGLFRHAGGAFRAQWVWPETTQGLDSEGRLVDKAVAEAALAKVAGRRGLVEAFKCEAKRKAPPLPHSLSSLQVEASAALGLTAKQTLDLAQALYEKHGATTYPRSDSRHLPTSFLPQAEGILGNLARCEAFADAARAADPKRKSAAFDDAKVTDHHGIVPTSEFDAALFARMSEVERKLFRLIARAFIAQFLPDMRYESRSAALGVEGERFEARGRRTIDQGWRIAYGGEEDEDAEEEAQGLPDMKRGDPVLVEAVENVAKRTKPPARFTDGTLVKAMTEVHKFVASPEVKKRLRETDGIGTEATRAEIIETLVRRAFLARKGKSLCSTPTGGAVTDALPADVLDPGMTALWEGFLDGVAKGKQDAAAFMAAVLKVLRARVERGRAGGAALAALGAAAGVEPLDGTGSTCPTCGKGKLVTKVARKGENKGKRFLSCDAWPACTHSRWPDSRAEGDRSGRRTSRGPKRAGKGGRGGSRGAGQGAPARRPQGEPEASAPAAASGAAGTKGGFAARMSRWGRR